MPGRDCQRGRVYAWEKRVIAPRDRSLVPFASAQGMVDAIWAEQGLRFPPKVVLSTRTELQCVCVTVQVTCSPGAATNVTVRDGTSPVESVSSQWMSERK